MRSRTKLLGYCFCIFLNSVQPSQSVGYVIEWGWNTAAGTAEPAREISTNAVAISAGAFHNLALNRDSTVFAWGDNFFGETLGYKTSGKGVTNGMVQISGQILSNVMSIVAGRGFSLGLKADGTVVTWGENIVPRGLSNTIAVAAAGFRSLALKADGTVVEWESQESFPQYGELHMIPDLSNVVAIAIGEAYQGTRNVVLKSDGTVGIWGLETIYKDATPPTWLSNVTAVAAGDAHTLALKRDGTVIGWGFNKVGQATGVPTANGPWISPGAPVRINGKILGNVVAIAAGRGYSMALKKDGSVVAWGRMVNDLYPVILPAGLSNIVAISAGDNFCLAITTNKAVADSFREK